MTNSTQDTTPKAEAKGVSLYPVHWEYLKQKAHELTQYRGKTVKPSGYIQQLIEADMKKHKGTLNNLVVKGE